MNSIVGILLCHFGHWRLLFRGVDIATVVVVVLLFHHGVQKTVRIRVFGHQLLQTARSTSKRRLGRNTRGIHGTTGLVHASCDSYRGGRRGNGG